MAHSIGAAEGAKLVVKGETNRFVLRESTDQAYLETMLSPLMKTLALCGANFEVEDYCFRIGTYIPLAIDGEIHHVNIDDLNNFLTYYRQDCVSAGEIASTMCSSAVRSVSSVSARFSRALNRHQTWQEVSQQAKQLKRDIEAVQGRGVYSFDVLGRSSRCEEETLTFLRRPSTNISYNKEERIEKKLENLRSARSAFNEQLRNCEPLILRSNDYLKSLESLETSEDETALTAALLREIPQAKKQLEARTRELRNAISNLEKEILPFPRRPAGEDIIADLAKNTAQGVSTLASSAWGALASGAASGVSAFASTFAWSGSSSSEGEKSEGSSAPAPSPSQDTPTELSVSSSSDETEKEGAAGALKRRRKWKPGVAAEKPRQHPTVVVAEYFRGGVPVKATAKGAPGEAAGHRHSD